MRLFRICNCCKKKKLFMDFNIGNAEICSDCSYIFSRLNIIRENNIKEFEYYMDSLKGDVR